MEKKWRGPVKIKLKSERSGEAFIGVEVETKTETRGEEIERFGEKVEIRK